MRPVANKDPRLELTLAQMRAHYRGSGWTAVILTASSSQFSSDMDPDTMLSLNRFPRRFTQLLERIRSRVSYSAHFETRIGLTSSRPAQDILRRRGLQQNARPPLWTPWDWPAEWSDCNCPAWPMCVYKITHPYVLLLTNGLDVSSVIAIDDYRRIGQFFGGFLINQETSSLSGSKLWGWEFNDKEWAYEHCWASIVNINLYILWTCI